MCKYVSVTLIQVLLEVIYTVGRDYVIVVTNVTYVYDNDIFLTHFFPVLPFDTTEKNKRRSVFHLELKRNIGKKRVKLVTKTLFNI